MGITIGSVFANRYKILSELGRGGMGSIYKAQDNKLHEEVVLKLLLPELQKHPEVIKRFILEIRLALKITHENVVRIYDIGEFENRHYLTMELIEGVDLKNKISEIGAIELKQGLDICIQICLGLEAAHKKGVIHRDMKPQNIIIDTNNRIKIVDFGIAKIGEDKAMTSAGMTKEGMVIGTPEYMSPEQALGKKVDYRTDIYSVGVIMYELFTGHLPFFADKPMNILIKHVKDPPRAPTELNPNLPFDLERVILKTLAKDRDQRFQTINELKKALNSILDEKTAPVELEVIEELSEIEAVSEETTADLEDSTVINQNETDHIEKLFKRGMELFKQRQFSEALTYFQRVIDKDPHYKMAYNYIEIAGEQIAKNATVSRLISAGKQAFSKKDYETSLSYFEKASKLSPDNPEIQINLKYIREVYDGKPASIAKQQAVQMKHDENVGHDADENLFDKGERFYKEKKYPEAIEALQTFQSKNPDDPRTFEVLELAKAAFSAKQEIEHHFLTGKRLFEEGDKAAAIQELQICLDFDPEHEEAIVLLKKLQPGSDEDDDEDLDKLEGDFSSVPLDKNPHFKRILKAVQKTVQEHNFDEAISMLEKAKDSFQGNDEIIDGYVKRINFESNKFFIKEQLKKGVQLIKEGHFQLAMASFKKVIAVDPENKYANAYLKQCREEISILRKKQEQTQKLKITTKEKEAIKSPKYTVKKSGFSPILIVVVAIVLLAVVAIVFSQTTFFKQKLSNYYVGKGQVLFSQKQYRDASEFLQKAYDLVPTDDILDVLAPAYFYDGDYGQALTLFKQLLKEKGNVPKYHFFIGKIYCKKGDTSKSIVELKKVLRKNPRDFEAMSEIGKTYYYAKKYSSASLYFSKSLKVKPDNLEVRLLLVKTYIAIGKTEAAVGQLLTLTRKNKNLPEPFIQLGEIYIKQGKYLSAISILKKHPSYKAGTAELFYLIGKSYERLAHGKKGNNWLKNIKQAQKYYKNSFIIDPSYKDVLKHLTSLLRAQRKNDLAIHFYSQFLQEFPNDVEANMQIGKLYQLKKKYGPAFDAFKKAADVDPKNKDAWNLLGILQQKRGNKREARNAFRKSLEIDPHQKNIRWRYNRSK